MSGIDIHLPEMLPLAGVRLNSVESAMRYRGRDDLALIELCSGSVAAACFTQNRFCAAPVQVARNHISRSAPRYLLINAGNANACTGDQGRADALRSCEIIADVTGVTPEEVLPFSTGIIGEPMVMSSMVESAPGLVAGLVEDGWEKTARAIMTTDTVPKMVTGRCTLGNVPARINGIAKGAGMIRPNMATMLAFVVTDVCVSQQAVDELCRIATEKSFNRVTVDGDTSTNDSVVLAATGKAGNFCIESLDSTDGQVLEAAVTEQFQALAKNLVRDGEGATKFATIEVSGAATAGDALRVAYAVAHSPLVKTALFASDPNWGRLVAAIGRSGAEVLEAEKVRVYLNEVLIVEQGGVAHSYTEALGQAVFDLPEVCIRIDLGIGGSAEQVWTCDLSHDYVSINADYRS